MQYRKTRAAALAAAVVLLVSVSLGSYAIVNPPLCPHVIGWNGEINTWAQGAPWIKVIFATDIVPAQATGAKVFYRPFTADTVYWENGYLPMQRTGATYADLVWAQISGLAVKPDAVSYRNEFDWANVSMAKRTCAEFVNYKNRLRELGYTGKVIFGSFSPDWVSATTWQDPDLMAAVNASDGVETHEYFDFEVNCCLPNRCFRHRDIAIANNPYLVGKDWYIGEFGSDVDHGRCAYCGDGLWRTGWRDRNKLSEQQYIDQMKIYRAGCSPQVVAVFVYQQGDQTSWSNYEVVGTSVATYMRTTWPSGPGWITGTIKGDGGELLNGATVTVSPGGYSAQSASGGAYRVSSVPEGTYSVTVTKPGYGQRTIKDVVVERGLGKLLDVTMTPIGPISATKTAADGRSVTIAGIVTARILQSGSQTAIYIENPERTNAIRVSWPGAVNVGDKVEVSGTMDTTDTFERTVAAESVTQTGTGVIKPLFVPGRSVGGNSLPYDVLSGAGQSPAKAWHWVRYDNQPPIREMTDVGCLNNTGLLVKTAGKVTASNQGFFYLDDGSGWDDFETPNAPLGKPAGLKVALPENTPAPSVGSFVTVTGISSFYKLPYDIFAYRLLLVSRAQDVVTVLR